MSDNIIDKIKTIYSDADYDKLDQLTWLDTRISEMSAKELRHLIVGMQKENMDLMKKLSVF